MAGVTSEILSNMMRSTMSNLKNFAEMLNAELSEEGQDANVRASSRETFVSILNAFGDSEAYFEKGKKCVKDVEVEMNRHFQVEDTEIVSQDTLKKEILDIIKIVDGKQRIVESEEFIPMDAVDEGKIVQQLENVQEILNQYHPLKFRDDDEDEDSGEEERISNQLERMQKKAMKKMENRLNAVNEDDDNYANNLDEETEFSDSGDEESMDCDSMEKPPQANNSKSNQISRKSIETKLNHMWTEYQNRLKDIESIDVKKVYDDMFDAQGNIAPNNLPFFAKYNDSILEQFTGEAIFVLREETNFVDPISKRDIVNPVRNKKCNHIYEKDTVVTILKKKKEMACPIPGCSCKSFVLKDLEEDEDTAEKISQNLAKKLTVPLSQEETENMDTEDLDPTLTEIDPDESDDDNARPSTSNAESQELF